MFIESIFVSGRCQLNCPDCPYKSDLYDDHKIHIRGKKPLEFFYGGDVLDSIESAELKQYLNKRPELFYKQQRIIQTTPLNIEQYRNQLKSIQAIVMPQVIDYSDSIESTGRDIVKAMQEAIILLKEEKKKIILVAQVNDLNVNTLIDNYYLASDNKALLVLNISDITPNKEEKAYLKYLTKKSNVIATQRVPGTCCYTPGFLLNAMNLINYNKLFWFLWHK